MFYRFFPGVFLAFFLFVQLTGCGLWTKFEDYPCPNPDGKTKVTYTNFVKPFMTTYCDTCHSTNSMNRRGAPLAYIFDNYESVKTLKRRIFLRSAANNTTMPPGPDDPPETARMKLAEWIVCGTPK